MSARRSVRQSVVVSEERERTLSTYGGGHSFVIPRSPPALWPAILLSFLHFTSMAAAMMVWIDACRQSHEAECCEFAYSWEQQLDKSLLVELEEKRLMVMNKKNITEEYWENHLTIKDKNAKVLTQPLDISTNASFPVEIMWQDAPDTRAQELYSKILAINGFCEFLTSQLMGLMCDKYGRRFVMFLSQLGQLVDYSLAALTLPAGIIGGPQILMNDVALALFMCRAIAGLMGNTKISLSAYLADISQPAELPVRMAYADAAMTVAFMLGPVIVGVIDAFGVTYRICFMIACCLNFSCILLVKFFWRDIAPKKDFVCADTSPMGSVAILRKSRALGIYAAMVYLDAFSLAIFMGTFTWHCEEILKMSKLSVMGLSIIFGLSSAISLAVIIPWMLGKFGEIFALKFSFAATCMFYVAFGFLTKSTSSLLFFMILVFSLGMGKAPLAKALASRETDPEDQGALQGAISLLETTGKIIAPILGGVIIIPMFKDTFPGMIYIVAGVVLAPGVAASFMLTGLTTRAVCDEGSFVEFDVDSKPETASQLELS